MYNLFSSSSRSFRSCAARRSASRAFAAEMAISWKNSFLELYLFDDRSAAALARRTASLAAAMLRALISSICCVFWRVRVWVCSIGEGVLGGGVVVV